MSGAGSSGSSHFSFVTLAQSLKASSLQTNNCTQALGPVLLSQQFEWEQQQSAVSRQSQYLPFNNRQQPNTVNIMWRSPYYKTQAMIDSLCISWIIISTFYLLNTWNYNNNSNKASIILAGWGSKVVAVLLLLLFIIHYLSSQSIAAGFEQESINYYLPT